MKIKYNELLKEFPTDHDKMYSMANIINLLTERNLDLITTSPDWIWEQSFDMTVTINGKELNPTLFLESVVKDLTNKNEEIENFKEKWKSKNSSASRLNNLYNQLGQVKNILKNIETELEKIK